MEKIYFPYVEYTARSQDRIREELNEIMNKRTTYGVVKSGSPQFANTEAALSWVLRGGLEYFYELDKQFLGEGNASGIPGIKADYFVKLVEMNLKKWRENECNSDTAIEIG